MIYALEDQVADLTVENEKLETKIGTLEDLLTRARVGIERLTDTLTHALSLQDRMLSEILHLHKHAEERLPLDLIEAKDQFDISVRKLMEEHRGR
jgi:hypothetical protein